MTGRKLKALILSLSLLIFCFSIPAISDASNAAWFQSIYTALNSLVGDRPLAGPPQLKADTVWQTGTRATPPPKTAVWAVTDDLSHQIECLALNIYWESKSEPLLGQVAVAAVTVNRVMDPAFPKTICDVVRQGGNKRRAQCHFSWWCDGRGDQPRDEHAWRQALSLASAALLNGLPDPTRGALWYHADYVRPEWSRDMEVVARIGRHIFYRMRPATRLARQSY